MPELKKALPLNDPKFPYKNTWSSRDLIAVWLVQVYNELFDETLHYLMNDVGSDMQEERSL